MFDWDETDSSDEEEVAATKRAKEEVEIDRHRHNVRRAKRLRKVYMACMRISRPVRTALIALIGGGILIVPAVVVWTAYANDRSSPVVRDNVKVWSIWLMVLWTCECVWIPVFGRPAHAHSGSLFVRHRCYLAACGTVSLRPPGFWQSDSYTDVLFVAIEHLRGCYPLPGVENLAAPVWSVPGGREGADDE